MITMGHELVKMLQSWPKEQFDLFRNIVFARAEEFRKFIKESGPEEFIKDFNEVFDDAVAKDQTLTSCTKGCHLCCRQSVNVYTSEAAVIGAYCKENGIEISKEYLKKQLMFGWKEIAKKDCGWCVFLKNGECSIYPVRPIACRNHFVISPPHLCDTVKYPSDKGYRIAQKMLIEPLMLSVAYGAVLLEKGKEGRMPEMLLPYSK